LHKILEDAKIQTNIEQNIKKYELSPLVSSRYVHQGTLHAEQLQKMSSKKGTGALKPSGAGKSLALPPGKSRERQKEKDKDKEKIGDVAVTLDSSSGEATTTDSDTDALLPGRLNVRNPTSPTTSGTLPDLRF